MSGVYYCSSTNSTFFTECCSVAITDSEDRCPVCSKYIYPYYEDMSDKERREWDYYYHRIRMARMRYARR